MIAKLRGIIDSVGIGHAVIDVNGVGYMFQASEQTLANLKPGEEVSLHIETCVREDAISLFAFRTLEEREWFRVLQSVQGVGAKVALAILAILPPADLAVALAAQDKASVGRAHGVGPRLATRIVVELKDKAVCVPFMAVKQKSLSSGEQLDVEKGDQLEIKTGESAISALENLGYERTEAFRAVMSAQATLETDETEANKAVGDDKLSGLISRALKMVNIK